MADEDDSKNKLGDKEGQGDTGDKAGQKGEGDQDDDQGEVKFTQKQQEHINSLLAEERRKEAKKAEKLKKELEGLKAKKTEGDDKTAKDDPRIADLEGRLAKYEADKLADKICADLKIPKEEREKYIRHVTATDEDGIKEQLRALKQDFAPKKTGTGTNPPKTGKPGKNDSINAYIRSKGRSKVF